jgi:hypothetical protein
LHSTLQFFNPFSLLAVPDFLASMRHSHQSRRLENNSGGYPSGQRGLTVNQLADAFGGSNPSPPTFREVSPAARNALIAQLAEHALGKGEVMGSNPIEGSVAESELCSIFSRREERWRSRNLTAASRT